MPAARHRVPAFLLERHQSSDGQQEHHRVELSELQVQRGWNRHEDERDEQRDDSTFTPIDPARQPNATSEQCQGLEHEPRCTYGLERGRQGQRDSRQELKGGGYW